MPRSEDLLTEVQFWAQVITDSEQTIVCSPDNESRIKCWIDARGLSGQYKVTASPFVPDDQLIVVDERAIDAANRKAMHEERRMATRHAIETGWQTRNRFSTRLVDPPDAGRITGS